MDRVDNPALTGRLPGHGPVLGVFAKEPRAGWVKTRLTPPLTPGQACQLYRVALRETVARFAGGAVPLVLCASGRQGWFARAFPGVPLLPQGRGDLGARLARATARLFAAGAGPVAVAGSDSPDLPLARIEAAFAALENADAAVVPCRDGGYAVLALRRPAPALFAAMPWSTAELLTATQRRATEAGLHLVTLGAWDDIDDLPALRRLLERSPECMTAQHVRAHLDSLLSS